VARGARKKLEAIAEKFHTRIFPIPIIKDSPALQAQNSYALCLITVMHYA
jgi:hypothetical protein